MSTQPGPPLVSGAAEPHASYLASDGAGWVEVLVDCSWAQGLFTYQVPLGMVVQPGDILSVPFGAQQIGAIAVQTLHQLPPDLDPAQIRLVDSIVSTGFFAAAYWRLLQRVADYYGTPLIQVVRLALPPGLLARSQRRIRLRPEAIIPAQLTTMSATAQALLHLLQTSKTGDYSWQYLQRQIQGCHRGLQELLQAAWVESYIEPPTPARPKQRQVVTTVSTSGGSELTERQQEVLAVLKRQGGEMWLTDLLQHCRTTTATIKKLAQQGDVVVQSREVLRAEQGNAAIAPDHPKPLTEAQQQALNQIQALSGFATVLLHGVTGSGKTEVYLQAIAPVLARGQSALVLVPEIGLTPQLTDRFRARFGTQVRVYHSALSDGERYDTWRQTLTRQPQIIIGTRSAVFVPLPNLGIIVLDEEHDSSFKQDQPAPCYHARAVAHWRAELEQCVLILGSATPSLETWVNTTQASAPTPPTRYLSLPDRVHSRPLPTIKVVDMRQELHDGNRSIFSNSLQAALRSLYADRQQGILFMHRRGHSTFVSCRSCGEVINCPHCDVSLAYHQPHAEARPLLRCHYCNYTQPHPSRCPTCDSLYLKHFGSGTQRVAQELQRLFPELKLLRFDSDTTRTKGSHRALLTQFAAGEADLLIGTQMLTKGIDLPQVALVGIMAADGLLHFSDYRASERAFQTLTQVAGRCGRGDTPGQVILQTYSPEDPVIQAVCRYDYETFIRTELEQRQQLLYPPFSRLMLLRFSSTSAISVESAAERMAEALRSQNFAGIELLGPAPAPILRVARRYRWHILLKQSLDSPPHLLDPSFLHRLCPNNVSLTIDVDPINLG